MRDMHSIEAETIMVEIHEKVYATHSNGHMIALKIIRVGCY